MGDEDTTKGSEETAESVGAYSFGAVSGTTRVANVVLSFHLSLSDSSAGTLNSKVVVVV